MALTVDFRGVRCSDAYTSGFSATCGHVDCALVQVR